MKIVHQCSFTNGKNKISIMKGYQWYFLSWLICPNYTCYNRLKVKQISCN
uniref:Uncharacterized protein n=1 Tax=Rhizophora mucronata TaxID=61149 RepID=A0A2P2N8Z5_RHIMU